MLSLGTNLVMPGTLLQMQKTSADLQGKNPGDAQYDPNVKDFAARQQMINDEMNKEKGANLLTDMLVGRAGGMAGRGIPAYNKYEQ